MSMFNECLIHLCDCTLLNVLYILKQMLIKQKNIFEYFQLFLESVFVLYFFQKIQKSVQPPCFGNSLSRVKLVARPQSQAYLEALTTL